MPQYQFTFVTSGFDNDNDRRLLAIEDAFCSGDEVSVYFTQGRNEICFFDQKAPTALEAMKKTYQKLKKVVPDVNILYVDEDLVSISDIAGRVGESKKEIRLLAKNCGTFPTPVGILGGGKRIWRWQDVYMCIDAIYKYEWLNNGNKLKDYDDTLGFGGEYVDRKTVAIFNVFVNLEQTRKQEQITKPKKKTVTKRKAQ